MHTYSENIFLGNQLLNLAKQTTISSNDIIPKALMPMLSRDLMFPLMMKFGQLKIEQYIHYIYHCQSIRNILLKKAQSLSIPHKMTAGLLAVAHLGSGEASELTHVVYANLIQRGAWNFTMVNIQSDPNQHSRHPHPFGHSFILLGCQLWLETLNKTIRQVNDNQQLVELYDQYLAIQARIVAIQ